MENERKARKPRSRRGRCSPARFESGPPYCMSCSGTGYIRVSIARFPWTDLIDCTHCAGTGRAKDHPVEDDLNPDYHAEVTLTMKAIVRKQLKTVAGDILMMGNWIDEWVDGKASDGPTESDLQEVYERYRGIVRKLAQDRHANATLQGSPGAQRKEMP